MLLGCMVMLAGAITFIRGLPAGVPLRPGRLNPKGNWAYLLSQEALGLGLALLALDVALTLASRPFLTPGIVCVVLSLVPGLRRRWIERGAKGGKGQQ